MCNTKFQVYVGQHVTKEYVPQRMKFLLFVDQTFPKCCILWSFKLKRYGSSEHISVGTTLLLTLNLL